MFVHNVLFAGSYEGKYFKEVVVEDNEKIEIEHDTYLEVFGQSEELPTMSFNEYADEYLEYFENDEEEYRKEKEKLQAWHSLSGLDVHTFDVKPDRELVIEVWN